jgi:uncharacterized Zn finger protein
MRLSQVFASSVSARSRSRGESYFRSGAVQQLTASGDVIEATVVGSVAYSVMLQPSDDMLSGSCTCLYFVDHFEICKHIWATILAAESESISLAPPGRQPSASARRRTSISTAAPAIVRPGSSAFSAIRIAVYFSSA